ncbi:fatty acid synthase alpha subunit Lsd1 [Stygiomarasmius scandens]|uniref:Fatty acid synthase alpha subunit Lsd1 n=1 Tax=Marasmiellus scandens TaxID=2682957 RepID=A0ABR1JS13_9AGAR
MFETTEEPGYIVDFPTDAAVGVLLSREWFDWDNESKPLTAGTSLVFCIQPQVSFKNRTSFHDVAIISDIFIRDQLKNLVKVGSVDFRQVDSHGNPVLAYLQRHGKPEGLTVPLANNGYSLTTFNAPLTNEPYSSVSGNLNPIHANPYSCYASLSATITHDLWSSPATCHYIENVV